MSVRRRAWKNRDGSQGETWIVAYRDHAGVRRYKSFDKKRAADAYHAEVKVDVRKGIHTAGAYARRFHIGATAGQVLQDRGRHRRAHRVHGADEQDRARQLMAPRARHPLSPSNVARKSA